MPNILSYVQGISLVEKPDVSFHFANALLEPLALAIADSEQHQNRRSKGHRKRVCIENKD